MRGFKKKSWTQDPEAPLLTSHQQSSFIIVIVNIFIIIITIKCHEKVFKKAKYLTRIVLSSFSEKRLKKIKYYGVCCWTL